jgi:hypothetical protein
MLKSQPYIPARLISHGTIFFSYNKTASAGLSAAETISSGEEKLTLEELIK